MTEKRNGEMKEEGKELIKERNERKKGKKEKGKKEIDRKDKRKKLDRLYGCHHIYNFDFMF
jgi:hypothetical protein